MFLRRHQDAHKTNSSPLAPRPAHRFSAALGPPKSRIHPLTTVWSAHPAFQKLHCAHLPTPDDAPPNFSLAASRIISLLRNVSYIPFAKPHRCQFSVTSCNSLNLYLNPRTQITFPL